MTPEEFIAAIAWLQKLGPTVLSVFGSVNAVVLGLLGYSIRWAWRKHQEREAKMADAVNALAKAVDQMQEERFIELQTHRDAMHGLRAEMGLTVNALRHEVSGVAQSADRTTREVAGVSAICKLQQDEISKTNAALALVAGKLEAVFRFIDAPRRPTDANGQGS